MKGKKTCWILLAAVMLTACDSQPKQAQEPAPVAPEKQPLKTEPEQETGRRVFQRLYITARNWAPDAQPVRLESGANEQARGREGKAAIWRARFASPSARGAIKSFQWSGMPGDDGITPGTEDNFNPNNAQTRPFDFAFLKSDSDEAFREAQEHGGEKFLEKNKDALVEYELEWNGRKNELYWIVRYRTGGSKLNVLVNASTGKFVRVLK